MAGDFLPPGLVSCRHIPPRHFKNASNSQFITSMLRQTSAGRSEELDVAVGASGKTALCPSSCCLLQQVRLSQLHWRVIRLR